MQLKFIFYFIFLIFSINIVNSTEITLCNDSGLPSSTYTLLNDLYIESNETCYLFNQDNIIFDCNWNKIINNYGNNYFPAIEVNSISNLTFKNCIIENFPIGINTLNSLKINFENIIFSNNEKSINIIDSDYIEINNLSVNFGKKYGFFFYNSKFNNIKNSKVNNITYVGLHLENFKNSSIKNLSLSNNLYAFYFQGNSSLNKIFLNKFINNTNNLFFSIFPNIDETPQNNIFYLNNLNIEDKKNSQMWDKTINKFDNGSLGNFWKGFSCLNFIEINGYKICQNPNMFIIDEDNNINDRYPLVYEDKTLNTNINSCLNISNSGKYNINESIYPSSDKTCFILEADNIEIDCLNNTIDGGKNIFELKNNNIIIKNCKFKNNEKVFNLENSSGHFFKNIDFENIKGEIFNLKNIDNSNFENIRYISNFENYFIKLDKNSNNNRFININLSNLADFEIINCNNSFLNFKFENGANFYFLNENEDINGENSETHSLIYICSFQNKIIEKLNVKTKNIDSENLKHALIISNSKNISIKNSNFENYISPIKFINVHNSKFENNTIDNFLKYGLSLSNSSENEIYLNNFSGKINSYSVYFNRDTEISKRNVFYLNYFSNNVLGLNNSGENLFTKTYGNYWEKFVCLETEKLNNYNVCISPLEYVLDTNEGIKDTKALSFNEIKLVKQSNVIILTPIVNNSIWSNSNISIRISSNENISLCSLYFKDDNIFNSFQMVLEDNICVYNISNLKTLKNYSFYSQIENLNGDKFNSSLIHFRTILPKDTNQTEIYTFFELETDFSQVPKIILNGNFQDKINSNILKINELSSQEISDLNNIEAHKFIKVFNIAGLEDYEDQISSAKIYFNIEKIENPKVYFLDFGTWSELNLNELNEFGENIELIVSKSKFGIFAILIEEDKFGGGDDDDDDKKDEFNNFYIILIIIFILIILILAVLYYLYSKNLLNFDKFKFFKKKNKLDLSNLNSNLTNSNSSLKNSPSLNSNNTPVVGARPLSNSNNVPILNSNNFLKNSSNLDSKNIPKKNNKDTNNNYYNSQIKETLSKESINNLKNFNSKSEKKVSSKSKEIENYILENKDEKNIYELYLDLSKKKYFNSMIFNKFNKLLNFNFFNFNLAIKTFKLNDGKSIDEIKEILKDKNIDDNILKIAKDLVDKKLL